MSVTFFMGPPRRAAPLTGMDLDIHPVGKGDGLQVAHLTRAQMGKAHGDDQSGGKQKKEGPAPLAAATAAGGGRVICVFMGEISLVI